MSQPFLLFALGALVAALLALLAWPAARRRAARAERRRLEGLMPMTPDAIEAGRDALRAEFAVERVRLERKSAEAEERASLERVAAARAADETRKLKDETRERDERLAAMAAEGEALRGERDAATARAAASDARVAQAEAALNERQSAGRDVERQLEETTYLASSRQIDLVARETEVERLREELEQSRAREAGLGAELVASREAEARAARAAGDAAETARALGADAFGAQARVEAAQAEAERLRREVAHGATERDRLALDLVEARRERVGVELEFGALQRQLSALFPGTVPGGDPATGLRAAAAERDRIERMVATLDRENNELRGKLERAGEEADARLREGIMALAAEVTALAARLEGDDGAIARALAARDLPEDGASPSLAERIARLRDRL